MKKTTLNLTLIALYLFSFTACEKSDNPTINHIEGTYVGTFTTGDGFKKVTDAVVDVLDFGDGQVEVRFSGAEIDTTITLNYYKNSDSVNVCLNGDAFQAMYGRMMQNDMMQGGMMMGQDGMAMDQDSMGSGGMMMGQDGMSKGTAKWSDHLNANHMSKDKHFGGFDMNNQTFSFTIKKMGVDYKFKGKKM